MKKLCVCVCVHARVHACKYAHMCFMPGVIRKASQTPIAMVTYYNTHNCYN